MLFLLGFVFCNEGYNLIWKYFTAGCGYIPVFYLRQGPLGSLILKTAYNTSNFTLAGLNIIAGFVFLGGEGSVPFQKMVQNSCSRINVFFFKLAWLWYRKESTYVQRFGLDLLIYSNHFTTSRQWVLTLGHTEGWGKLLHYKSYIILTTPY